MAYDASSVAKTDKRHPDLAAVLTRLTNYVASQNIAEELNDEQLRTIGYDVEREYKIDRHSREDWEKSATKAMDIALQLRQTKTYPFEGAANIKYPLVTVAALQFGARAYPAIIDGNRVVMCQVIGSDEGQPQIDPQTGQPAMQLDPNTGQPAMGTNGQPAIMWQVEPGAKRERADRISEHMSYQLLTEMQEWEEDTDVLLHHIPIIGCAFRKVWRSEELKRNKAIMIAALDLVVNSKVRSLDEAPRVTHCLTFYEQEIEEKKRAGIWLEIDLPSPNEAGEDEDAPHKFLEQHRYLDLDDDGYREPYIVTVHEESCQVVRIVANYRMEDVQFDGKRVTRIPKAQYFVKYSFIPDPRGGFYDIGFGRLLESLSETIDTTLNQMLDAGHLSVAGGGFIGSGVRFKKNKVQVSPGKYEVVNLTGSFKDQIHAHQFPEPSAVLFQLLGMMIETAKDITAVKDILTGDSGTRGVQTATTTLALIEQGLKVFTAIYKRIYRALKREFKLLFLLNSQYLDDKAYYTVMDQKKAVAKTDYDPKAFDVNPVSDPKTVTDMQRGAKAQVLMSLLEHPAIGMVFNPREVAKSVCSATGIEDIERLMKPEGGPTPMEQIALEGAQADVQLKKSQATKAEAEAALTITNVRLAPHKQAHEMERSNAELVHNARRDHHGMLMVENNANIAAASHDLEKERHVHEKQSKTDEANRDDGHRKADRDQADRHHGDKIKQADAKEDKQMELALTKDDFERDKMKLPKRGRAKEVDAATTKSAAQVTETAKAINVMAESMTVLVGAVKEVASEVKTMAKDMNAPVAIQRGADGKPTSITKGDRTMKVVAGADGRPAGLQ